MHHFSNIQFLYIYMSNRRWSNSIFLYSWTACKSVFEEIYVNILSLVKQSLWSNIIETLSYGFQVLFGHVWAHDGRRFWGVSTCNGSAEHVGGHPLWKVWQGFQYQNCSQQNMLRGSCLCLPWRGAMSLEACYLFVLKVVHIPQQNPRVPKPHERNAIPDATHRYTIRVVKRKHHSTCRALVNLQDCCEPYELYDLIGSLHWNYPPSQIASHHQDHCIFGTKSL